MHSRTRRLTECALLTAMAVILDLSSLVPLLGVITVLLCALPSVYISMVHGLKWAIASAAAAATILTFSYGPHEGLAYLSLFAATGLALGFMARRGSQPMTILAAGTLVVSLSMCCNVFIIEELVGIPASDRLGDGLRQGMHYVARQGAELTHAAGLTSTAVPSSATVAAIDTFMRAPLTILVVMAFLVVYANYLAAALVFYRLGLPWEAVPDPRCLQMPRWLSPLLLANLFVPIERLAEPNSLLAIALYNVLFIAWAVAFLAGLSLLIGFMDSRAIFHPLKRLALMALFLVPLLPLTILAAIVDAFLDFRHLRQVA